MFRGKACKCQYSVALGYTKMQAYKLRSLRVYPSSTRGLFSLYDEEEVSSIYPLTLYSRRGEIVKITKEILVQVRRPCRF